MARRIRLIQNHITRFPTPSHDPSLDQFRKRGIQFNKKEFEQVYFGQILNTLHFLRSQCQKNAFFNSKEQVFMQTAQIRQRNLQRVADIGRLLNLSLEMDKEKPMEKFSIPYVFSEHDQQTTTLTLVHIGLYLDTLQSVGTQKHRELIDRAYRYQDFGCFAMTELGHGSDVSSLETQATYDTQTNEFIINSPTATSAKWWIGGLAKNANQTVIFANLTIEGENKGIHVFVAKIRDENHQVVPGVIIGDCGPKIGLTGIDNGFAIFKDFRVPNSALLDKYSQVTPEGKYKSTIASNQKRLGIQLGGLIRGRMCIIIGTESHIRTLLTIAIRYSAIRKQFGEKKETTLLDYQSHQYRLIPILGDLIAFRAISLWLQKRFKYIQEVVANNPESNELTEFHAILSAVKAVTTWTGIKSAQMVREALGGHGYAAYSSVGRIRNIQDIHTTWEGDNTILLQQTSKFLMKELQGTFKGRKIVLDSVQFLCVDYDLISREKARFQTQQELLNTENLIGILEFRCNYLLHLSLNRMQESAAKESTMMKAWNSSQVFYLQQLAIAFGQLNIAKSFHQFIKTPVKDPQITQINTKIFFLYCLNLLEKNLPIFLDFYIEASQARLIRQTILSLCKQIAESSVNIIDAIGVPDYFHQSALGQEDGQIYKQIISRVESDPTCYQKAGWSHLILDMKQKGKAERRQKQEFQQQMPRKSTGFRSGFGKQVPNRSARAASVPRSYQGQRPSMMAGLGGTLMQGMAFGAGSQIAHTAIRGAVGGSQGYEGHQQFGQQNYQQVQPCVQQNQDFLNCLQMNKNDVGICQSYLDLFKQCRGQF